MEENLPIKEDTIIAEAVKSYFRSIWTQPKATFKSVLDCSYDNRSVAVLLMLGGVVRAVDRAFVTSLGDRLPTAAVLTIAILAGAALGWMTYYLFAWLISKTGKWLNGIADARTIRVILAWSSIPVVASLLLLVPQVIIFGDDLFRSEISNPTRFKALSGAIISFIKIGLSIWSLILIIKGIGLAQAFGPVKAILNLVIAAVMLILPFLMLGFLTAIIR